MKITFKTLKGEQFQIDIEPTQTILNLKESVQQQKGLEIDTIKLVHKGKQHPDEKTIQECNIQEGEFIVITTSKKPGQPQQQPQQQQQAQQPVGSSNTTSNVTQSTSQVSQQNQAQNRPANNSSGQGNNLVIGEEHRQNVEMIVAMGFEKEKVELALRAAYMNPDRAIEYLINNNIPAFDQQDPNMSGGDQEEDFGEGGDLPEQLEALANQPMFVRLREAISQNPAMLQPIMQNIQEESPEIFQLIQSYPQLLLGNGQQGGGQQQQQQQQPRPSNRIMISQEDKEAIERIHSLGFSKQDSLEAYLACGKDENMAVNLLLEKQEKGDLYSQEDDQALIQQAIEQSNLQHEQQLLQQQQQQQQQQQNQPNQNNQNNQNNSNNQNQNNQGDQGGSGNNNNNGGNGGSDNIFD